MRTIRLVIAVLVGLALAVAPVAADFAMAPMGQSEVGMNAPATHDMLAASTSDDSCMCCDASGDGSAAFCLLKCCGAAAILVEAQSVTGAVATSRADTVAAALSPFSRQPDPPPPRS